MKQLSIVLLSLALLFLLACNTQPSDKSKNGAGVSDVEEITMESVDSISAEIDSTRSEIDKKMNDVDQALDELE